MLALAMTGTVRGQQAAAVLPDAPSVAGSAGSADASPSEAAWYAGAIRAHQREQWRRKWLPLIADAGARGLDTVTTLHVVGCVSGAYQGELATACRADRYLPDAIAEHPAAMSAYSAGVVGVVWLAGRELRRHGRGRLAAALGYGDAVWDGQFAVRNLWIRRVTMPTTVPVLNGPTGPLSPLRGH